MLAWASGHFKKRITYKLDALRDEWNKETAKRHESEPIFECKNLKELGKRVRDKKTRDVILELTDRIIQKFKPEKVVLFGSQARGDARPDSDIDLLVIFKNNIDSFKKLIAIRALVADKSPIQADIVVASRNELKKHGDSYAYVFYYAIRNGLVLYLDHDEDALSMLERSSHSFKNCTKYAKNKALKEHACHHAYMTVKQAFQFTFIADHMPYPDTGDLDEIRMLMSDWKAKNLYDDLSCITALRWKSGKPAPVLTNVEIQRMAGIATDIFESVEKEFETRGIH